MSSQASYVGRLNIHVSIIIIIILFCKMIKNRIIHNDNNYTIPNDWYLQPLRIVRLYLKKYPNWIRSAMDDDGDSCTTNKSNTNLPIHTAIHEHASLDIIKLLYNKHPESIKIPGKYGWLPLHYAVACNVSYETFLFIIKCYPLATNVLDNNCNRPINLIVDECNKISSYYYINNNNNVDIATTSSSNNIGIKIFQELVRVMTTIAKKNRIKTQTTSGDDNDCFMNSNSSITITTDYSNVIQTSLGEDGSIVHRGILKNFSIPMLQTIMHAYKDAASIMDQYHRLPIHCIHDTTPIVIVQFLLQYNPTSLLYRIGFGYYNDNNNNDSDGDCDGHVNDNQNNVTRNNNSGYTPLHVAIMEGCHHEIIQYMIQVCPDCVRVPDNDGNLPIHIVYKYPLSPVDIIRTLAEAYPESLLCRNNDMNIPLHTSLLSGKFRHSSYYEKENTTTIQYMIDQCIDSVQCCNALNQLPIHIACSSLSSSSYETICSILESYEMGIHHEDVYGELPMHLALRNASNFPPMSQYVIRYLFDKYPQSIEVPFNIHQQHQHEEQSLKTTSTNNCYEYKIWPIEVLMYLASCQNRELFLQNTLHYIITQYKQILRKPMQYGKLPLHLAFNNDETYENVRMYLASMYPAALCTLDDQMCVGNNYNNEIQPTGLSSDDDASYASSTSSAATTSNDNNDGNNNLLTYNSRTNDDDNKRQQQFLRLPYYPRLDNDELCLYDGFGYNPIHIGCMNEQINKSIQSFSIRYYVQLCPEAATQKTKRQPQLLPLFLACQHDACLDIILCLLEYSLDELF